MLVLSFANFINSTMLDSVLSTAQHLHEFVLLSTRESMALYENVKTDFDERRFQRVVLFFVCLLPVFYWLTSITCRTLKICTEFVCVSLGLLACGLLLETMIYSVS